MAFKQGQNLVLIQSQTTAGALTVTFNSGITSKYSTYLLNISNLNEAVEGEILCQVSTDGGGTWVNSGYQGGNIEWLWNSNGVNNNFSTTAFMLSPKPTAGGLGLNLSAYFFNLMTAQNCMVMGTLVYNHVTDCIFGISGGYCSTANVNALQISIASGTNVSGTFTLYGVVE